MPGRGEIVADVVGEIRASLRALDAGLERLAEVFEERRGELDFDAGIADVRAGRTWPHAVARRLVAGDHPLKVFREHRGLSQEALARSVGTAKNYISQIETGVRHPGRSLRGRLAESLSVDPAEIERP